MGKYLIYLICTTWSACMVQLCPTLRIRAVHGKIPALQGFGYRLHCLAATSCKQLALPIGARLYGK